MTEFKVNTNKPEGCEFNTDTQKWEVVNKAAGTAQEEKKNEEIVPF